MSDKQLSILIVFILYLTFMVGIGFVFSRRKMTNADYVLGGRKLNPWVTAMSAQASDMSGWLLTGLPGLAYAGIVGSKEAIFTALGLLIGTLLNWYTSAISSIRYMKSSPDFCSRQRRCFWCLT